MSRTKVAVIGSGNIGTDLMIKILRLSDTLQVAAMVGIDPSSEGLARARRLGVPTTHAGVQGLLSMPDFAEIEVVFDATSADAHRANAAALAPYGKRLVDLTPAALGPYVVPAVNLDQHLDAPEVNMVTCGGQATIPVVAASPALSRFPTPRSSPLSRPGPPGLAPARASTSSLRRRHGPSKRWAALVEARPSSS
jgi:acetaldehyde dehydrogenase